MCGDPRLFADLTKLPQVFRDPGGSLRYGFSLLVSLCEKALTDPVCDLDLMSRPVPLRIAFITSTPMNLREGSGTFVGIQTLAAALARLGVHVDIVAPHGRLPVLTARRLLFNAWLPFRRWNNYDVIVGFDMDGYRIAGRTGRPHVAAIKGVIADELLYERGLARATMSLQARCEAYHVHDADRVIATSRYSAERLVTLYRLTRQPAIIPELIDLSAWRGRFDRQRIAPRKRFEKFVPRPKACRITRPGTRFTRAATC